MESDTFKSDPSLDGMEGFNLGDESLDASLSSLQDQGESLSGSEFDLPPADDHQNEGQNFNKLVCTFCNKEFAHRREMLMHQWTHKERQEFVCQVCDKPISNEKLFRRHMSVHFRDYSRHVRCKICQKAFRTPRAMEEHHEKYHRGQKPFVCSTCGLSFSWRDNLFKHERVHVDKPFACLVCHESFRDVNNLNAHIRQHRREQKDKEKAIIPNTQHTQQELHYRPLSNSNGSKPIDNDDFDDKEFKCKVCGMAFKYNFTLEAHMKGHADNLVAQAQVAAGPWNMKRSNSKTVEKPHVCLKCGEKFRWDFCLRAHMKLHEQNIVDGTVYYKGTKVPKPVGPTQAALNRYKIPSSKKLLMLEGIGLPVTGAGVKQSTGSSKVTPSTSQVATPSGLLKVQPVPTPPSVPDDLEPGEIRLESLDHLIGSMDMAVDEDNWEPMVPKPDPGVPLQDPNLSDPNKTKKKPRMIRVEQVPLEGRKKTTVVKDLTTDEDESKDDDEPVITSMLVGKHRKEPVIPSRGPVLLDEPEEGEVEPPEEYEELNFTESESDSGSDFENELKKRKKSTGSPKKKIKVEQDSDDEQPKSKRGRPRKDSIETCNATTSKRGRGRKSVQEEELEMVEVKKGRHTRNNQSRDLSPTDRVRGQLNQQETEDVSPPSKRGSGRPAKIKEEGDIIEVELSPLRTTRSRKARMQADAQIQQMLDVEHRENQPKSTPKKNPKKSQSKPKQDNIIKISKLKVYSCDLCQKAFTKRTALLAHRLFFHKGVKRSALKHSGIEMVQHKALLNKADHLLHRASIRLSQTRPYECMECGKAFAQQAYLTFHEESHDNITRTYTCHQCDLTMYSWLQCIQHQMLHRKAAR